jgi:hypothetical protein
MWPVPILFASIPHLPKNGSSIIRAKAALSLGLYFFNLEHGEVQTYDALGDTQLSESYGATDRPRPGQRAEAEEEGHDANPDNYGVDIMGAAESLAFEAVFMIRQNREQEYMTFSPKIAFQWRNLGIPSSPDSTSVGFGGEYPASKNTSLYFTSLGYSALKTFGDVLIRCNKHQFAIEIFEICIIILDSKGKTPLSRFESHTAAAP